MSKIPSPSDDNSHPDRFLHCQDAIHPAFENLVEEAVRAGWRAEEVLISLIELADNQALMMEANAEVDEAINVLRRKGFL